MDYYYHELEDLQKEFEDVLTRYPLFPEDIQEIEEKDLKEINNLIEKNDEYYLKEANYKLKKLINYIKDTNTEINREYATFDKLAKSWEKITFVNISDDELEKINCQVKKANTLIRSHDLKDIKEANDIMEVLIRQVKK